MKEGEENRKEVNFKRNTRALSKKDRAQRVCLCCNKKFESFGIQNRLCFNCKTKAEKDPIDF